VWVSIDAEKLLVVSAAETFSQPGLGGREGEVKELGVWGGNPSVTWNSYLQLWLITWHSWEPFDVMLSSSKDLLHWAPAVRIVVVSRSHTHPDHLTPVFQDA